jgi:hypothetical protein
MPPLAALSADLVVHMEWLSGAEELDLLLNFLSFFFWSEQ